MYSHQGSLGDSWIVSCQASVELQQDHSKTVDVHLWRQFPVPEELRSHVCHCSHYHFRLGGVGTSLGGASSALSSKSEIRETRNKMAIKENVGTGGGGRGAGGVGKINKGLPPD